jgi:prepilin peptidase CpaA
MLLSIFATGFFGLCSVAAVHDVNRLTIPNWLNLTIAGLFVPAAATAWLTGAVPLEILGGHIMAGIAAFVISYGLFAFRVFGGGDAKMIPAVMLWVGPAGAIPFVYFMAIAGGVCVVVILMVRKTVPVIILPRAIRAPFEEKAGVPYGVAIAFGALIAGTSSPLLAKLLNQTGLFH